MYVGHAAFALALKARDARVPIVPLALACYGPDWVEVALMLPHPREGMAPYTHSIPAVILGSAVASLLYAALAKRPGALLILIGWLSHWPADLLTGRKPIVGLEPLVGLDLYRLPLADLALETFVVLVCCALYARAFARTAAQRRLVIAMGAMLAALQLGLDVVMADTDPTPWGPSLARAERRTHLVSSAGVRTSLARHPRIPHSERVMEPEESAELVTLVCLTCGKEKYFDQSVPATVACDQCRGTVFRTFDTPTEPDDAVSDALEAPARLLEEGDDSPESMPDDARDLGPR